MTRNVCDPVRNLQRGRMGPAFELTFWCARHEPLLRDDHWNRVLAKSIDAALARHKISLAAFVFLPDCVRLVVVQNGASVNLPRLLYVVKRAFARWIRHELSCDDRALRKRLTVRDGPGRYRFRFWESGPGEVRELKTAADLSEAIDAVHAGPVEAGLCETPERWRWSSWRHYHDSAEPREPGVPRVQPVTDALSQAASCG